jgi:hypothetical protein
MMSKIKCLRPFAGTLLTPLLLTATVTAAQAAEDEHRAVMQVDLADEFAPFGVAGFFKLLADFTDLRAEEGHVAISNVPCDEEGTSPFVAVIANANVGAGNTQLALVQLNSANMVDGVSSPGTACTYHFDIHEEDYAFPVTDVALANGDESASHTPLPTASATIQAELVEGEREGRGRGHD